jgi:transposase
MSNGKECPNCERLEKLIARLQKQLDEQAKRIAELEAKLAAATKNSANSSKPPSSDIVKPPSKRKRIGNRKKGGQKGHKRVVRPELAEDELDWLMQYSYDACPDCGGPVTVDTQSPASTLQQIEIVTKPTEATEHQALACHCAACEKTHVATIPAEVRKAGLCGPELTSIIGLLKGACHASFATIRKYLLDVYGLKLSRGTLAKVIRKVSEAIAPLYEGLFENLKVERVLNIDETGHRDSGNRMWTWCFRAAGYTVFRVDPSRGSTVLLSVLGEEFNGVIGCDYFSAYHKYRKLTDCSVQFCFAHLIRDVRYLQEHSRGYAKGWSTRLLNAIREMFGVIHRRDELGDRFDGELEDAAMMVLTQAVNGVPEQSKAQNLAKRFADYGESYLKFLTTPGLEPTNNLAEQAIRFVVIDRKVTQGSKSETGQRWLERIWTLNATCQQRGVSLMDVLRSAVSAHFAGDLPPPLLPGA